MEISKRDIITVPNIMSPIGYGLVHDGIRRGVTTPAGFAEVFAGRMIDIGDGLAARLLNQSSDIGALLDASLDKLASKELLDAVVAEGLVPKLFERAMITQNAANAGLTVAAKLTHPKRKLTPSREGKRSMALQGLMLGSYALAEIVRPKQQTVAKLIRGSGHLLGFAGLFYYGPQATEGYGRRLA